VLASAIFDRYSPDPVRRPARRRYVRRQFEKPCIFDELLDRLPLVVFQGRHVNRHRDPWPRHEDRAFGPQVLYAHGLLPFRS
jgi:hypothetical protein